MYIEEYQRRGLHTLVLSRTLEGSGTITSPLIVGYLWLIHV